MVDPSDMFGAAAVDATGEAGRKPGIDHAIEVLGAAMADGLISMVDIHARILVHRETARAKAAAVDMIRLVK